VAPKPVEQKGGNWSLQLNYISLVARTIAAFFAILLVTRLLEKEQLGQLTFYEYITGITIGSLAADMAIAIVSPWRVLAALLVFSGLTYTMGYVSLKSRVARKLLEGEPTIVMQNGKIMEENMKKIRYNVDDLLVQLRNKDVFNPADVEFAILEPHGQISVLLKSQKKPVTREDMQIPTEYEGVSSELIMDGEIIYQNLQQNKLDEAWLINELNKQGITSPREVLLASLDTAGNLYVDRKHDNLQTEVRIQDTPDQDKLHK
jgi:uncharacterized membrane protein YcaP (DUF421 family)